ncbi:MAG: isopenicillin N synthase family oxygenase [Alphaproteobacteria bacterium]|nr:isopenicillin N synthase family oxygenase [Alphaproteobacteria bacterium]
MSSSVSSAFPVFDLGAYEKADGNHRQVLGREVDDICRSTGFLAVGNHGVEQAVIDRAWSKAEEFFNLSAADKQRAKAPFEGYPYGYLGPELEALAKSRGVDTPPDLKESFNGGPQAIPKGMTDPDALGFCYAATIWPDDPPEFQDAWKTYYRSMENLAHRIMDVFATALNLPAGFFDPFIDQPISALRALNYPAQTTPAKPGQLRAGAHTDYGSLTILLPQAGSRGLEIRASDGQWIPVPPVPGAFVINIGDLMARWTNDRWVSTLHRVVNPPPEEGGMDRRQSFAFFHQPNWHTEISCLPSCLGADGQAKYEPVLSGPYLMSKFQATTVPESSPS